MREDIQELNLTLLVTLRKHLDQAAELREQLDRLVKMATPNAATNDKRRVRKSEPTVKN